MPKITVQPRGVALVATDSASATAREADGDGDGSEANSEANEYDEMLQSLDVAIEEARRKVESGRVYDAENEKVRIKWIRALAYAVNVRHSVTADRDLGEITRHLDQLEEESQQERTP